ncbi:MAG: Rieske (2Fe-2S) protein [Myxococcota bacterium]|nr:Rieske (2Fe-2S) protein [Myxococcota bacterium]
MGFRDRIRGRLGRVGGDLRGRLRNSTAEQSLSAGQEALARYRRATEDLPEGEDAEGRVAVVRSEGIQEGMGRTFRVAGHGVALFRFQGEVFGIDNACTHEDAPLGEGRLDEEGVVKCPYHGWRYQITDGACLTSASRPVATYPVYEHEGVVWVGVADRAISTQRGGEHDDGLLMVEDDV